MNNPIYFIKYILKTILHHYYYIPLPILSAVCPAQERQRFFGFSKKSSLSIRFYLSLIIV